MKEVAFLVCMRVREKKKKKKRKSERKERRCIVGRKVSASERQVLEELVFITASPPLLAQHPVLRHPEPIWTREPLDKLVRHARYTTDVHYGGVRVQRSVLT